MRWWVAFLLLAWGCSSPSQDPEGSGDGQGVDATSADATTSSGDTESEDSAESDSTDADSGGSFAPAHDQGSAEPCNPWQPDCPAGQKCTAATMIGPTWDINICVEVMGEGQAGDSCNAFGEPAGLSGEDDCGPGLMCWEVDPDSQTGYCAEFCQGTPMDPECGSCSVCSEFNDGIVPLCWPTCDPLDPAGTCPDPDHTCIPVVPAEYYVCAPTTPQAPNSFGAKCTPNAGCAQGLFCADPADVPGCIDENCCTTFCDLSSPNACPAADQGQQCVEHVPADDEGCWGPSAGICMVP